MKRPINVQPEVKAYYLKIQMQRGGGGGVGEKTEALILSDKTGHIREQ